MIKVRLLKLRIENFRAIKELDLDFKGNDKVLAGTNEVGKTTVADAYTWLISDKDSKGNSQFEIKPLDENNEPIHHLNSIVEGTFQILKDGKFDREFTLKKDYHEKWVRKRGTTTEEFKGHTTDYYIEGGEETKGDYEDFIDNIIDYETLKLISDPLYFNEQVEWKDQRNIITQLIDRPDPGEVAAQIEKYYLAQELENTTTEKLQDKLKSKKSKVDKKLKQIPPAIKEVNKSIQEMNITGDKEELRGRLNGLDDRLEELQEKKAELKVNSQSSNMKKIIDLKSELQGKKEDLLKKANKRLDEYRESLNNLDRAKGKFETRIKNLENTMEMQEERKQRAEKEKESLLKEYHTEKAKTFNEEDKFCDKCGHALSDEQVKKLKAEFNKDKSDKLAEIKTKGKKQAKIIEDAEENIAEAKEGITKLQEQIDNLEYEPVEKGLEKGEEYKQKLQDNELPELKELAEQIDELQDKDVDGEPVDLTDINKKITDTKEEMKSLEKQITNIENKNKAEERLDELQSEEQRLADKYEELERKLYDLEKYIKAEMRLMEEDINNKFEIVEFKLFDKQVNGKIVETCEAMKNGIPYSEANTGSQYQMGMDIIRTLSEHYGISAPVIIDNRERIARLPEIESQTIQLVMTPARKQLEMLNLANEDEVAEFVEEEAGVEQESLF